MHSCFSRSRQRHSLNALTMLLVGLLLPLTSHAAGPDVFKLAPGVIVDRAGSRVYTMHQDRSVEAFDLGTGSRVWISDAAQKPLWAAGNTVYAQGFPKPDNGNLHILFLNDADGSLQPETLEVPLPTSVEPQIDEQRGKTFAVHLLGDAQSLLVSWDFLDQSSMPKPWPDAPTPKIVFEQGAALLDPVSEKVEQVSLSAVSPRSRAPAAVGLLLDTSTLKEPFWLAGTVTANITDSSRAQGGREIVLQRWDAETGAALQDITLFEGPVVSHMASADQQHYLVATLSGDTVNGVVQYRWSVFSLESGDLAGEFLMNTSAMPFSLAAGSVLLVTPPFGHLVDDTWVEVAPMVRKLDMQSGAEIWARPIRDTIYRGPVPSSPLSQ